MSDQIPRNVRIAFRLVILAVAIGLGFALHSFGWAVTVLCGGVVLEAMAITLIRFWR